MRLFYDRYIIGLFELPITLITFYVYVIFEPRFTDAVCGTYWFPFVLLSGFWLTTLSIRHFLVWGGNPFSRYYQSRFKLLLIAAFSLTLSYFMFNVDASDWVGYSRRFERDTCRLIGISWYFVPVIPCLFYSHVFADSIDLFKRWQYHFVALASLVAAVSMLMITGELAF